MQHPFANAAQSGGALWFVPMIVDPALAEKSKATLRAIAHGSSFQAPTAQPIESITRRFTSCTTSLDRSSNCNEQTYSASWCASVFVAMKLNVQSADENPIGKRLSVLPCALKQAQSFPDEQSLSKREGCARGPASRQHDHCSGRIRIVRHSRKSHRRSTRERRQRPHDCWQQCGRGRFRDGNFVADAPGKKSDGVICWREQGVRAAGFGGRVGTRAHSARNPRRTIARGRRGNSGVLYAPWLRHQTDRRQGNEKIWRLRICTRAGNHRRVVDGQGMEGRQVRQPHLPRNGAEF